MYSHHSFLFSSFVDRDDVIARIMRCDFHFDHEAWKTISDEAKEFIKDLIEIDPDGRLSAHQANETEWLQKQESESTLEKELIDLIHRTLLYQSEGSLMKKIALLIIAHHSSNEEIRELRNAFRQYDSNNDGIITFDDFKTTLDNFGYREEDCKFLFEKLVSCSKPPPICIKEWFLRSLFLSILC